MEKYNPADGNSLHFFSWKYLQVQVYGSLESWSPWEHAWD